MIAAALALLVIAGLCFGVRLVIGPTVASRIVALDGIVITVVAAIAVDAARTGSDVFLDAIVVVAVIGFVATSAAARFIEDRGD